ncbi:intermembrane transport protein PqiB [Thiocapsa rosea]|uniref:Paraquat-inducible protein B n=1 Tax=Thiocapsa rosea TaxID=69360 RepID=A0A495V7Z6_9GAMM|nr:MlaD family protein [Thiocapsa rosea]RKT45439.1 paraquat-inducible protein B [Thiocapsa rosea]
MSEPTTTDDLPLASLEPPRRSRASVVWIIPLLAAAVAIGIAVQRILTEGPTITLLFQTAAGVQAGKTVVKFKDVDIGHVTAVRLADRFSKVELTVKMDRSAAGLLVEDTRFWIVEPRVTLSGVSGLGTLISGNYIGLQPGNSTKEQRRFVGLDAAPAITDQPGRRFVLKASDLGSIGLGSPLYFRRLKVGEVVAYALAADGSGVDISVFVFTPYEQYVTPETRFWDASGIDVSLSAEGFDVRTQSLVSLLAGGVAFDVPSFVTATGPAGEGSVFTLFGSQTNALKQPDPVARRYVIYTDTLDGLQVGAPVKLLGIRAGEVAEIGLAVDPETRAFRPRLLITFFPERLVTQLTPGQQELGRALVNAGEDERIKLIRHQIEDLGLRVQLRTGNLLTGERYVALDYQPKAPKADMDWTRDPLELPVTPGGLADLESKASGILDQLHDILAKVEELPLEPIGRKLDSSLENLDRLLANADTETLPELNKTMAALRGAVVVAERVLEDTDESLLSRNSAAQQELSAALIEITRAARAVRVLSDYLERNPQALIRGKGKGNQ